MKLTGNTMDITAYHCREENYYYKQPHGINDLLTEGIETGLIKKGLLPFDNQSLTYVRAYGELAEELGYSIDECISEQDLGWLLQGKDRKGSKVLSPESRRKVHAIDLTFSAPKSVSIAGLVWGDNDILWAHRQAVLGTMKEIERRCGYANLGKGKSEYTGKLIWAQVDDGFSREKDPHLHTHCLVMNMTSYGDRFYAIDGKKIMRKDFYQMMDSLYKSELAKEVKELGYNITYLKDGEWRLDKISLDCEKAFSTRRQQILKAEGNGMRDMDAWRKTRKDKEPNTDIARIKRHWVNIFNTYQKVEETNKKETEAWKKWWVDEAEFSIEARQERENRRPTNTNQTGVIFQAALERATQDTAFASKEKLLTEVMYEYMRLGQYSDLNLVEKMLDDQVRQGNVFVFDGLYTSFEMMRLDRQYYEIAKRDIPTKGPLVIWRPDILIQSWNDNARKKLSGIQRHAAEQILKSSEQVVVVQGDAGSGKTTMLKAVKDIYQSSKYPVDVVGVCMEGVAAQNLEKETGIVSYTLRSYLSQKKAKRRSQVIIVDEASMLDSRNAAKLLELARQNNDKVVLVGDRNQLESIGAGRVFERLCALKEKDNKLIVMNENYRQRDDILRQAVDCARKGDMSKSLEILDKRGDIVEIENKLQKGQDPELSRWIEIAKHYNEQTLIIAGTNNARENLNNLIRQNLRAQLKHERIFDLARQDADGIDQPARLAIAEGDKITFTKNEYKDYDIRNGERATVLRINRNIISVLSEDGRKLDIDTEKYKYIDYGYALTTYKAQGQTYDKVVVDADTRIPSLNDFRNQYVNITRARESVKIYTDDRETLKDLADVLTHKQDTLDLPMTLKETIDREQRIRQICDRELGVEKQIQQKPEVIQTKKETRLTTPQKQKEPEVKWVMDSIGLVKVSTEKIQPKPEPKPPAKKFTSEYIHVTNNARPKSHLSVVTGIFENGYMEKEIRSWADRNGRIKVKREGIRPGQILSLRLVGEDGDTRKAREYFFRVVKDPTESNNLEDLVQEVSRDYVMKLGSDKLRDLSGLFNEQPEDNTFTRTNEGPELSL